ncbi:COG1361 S-layer family protein [Thermococcus thioreducens]|uniref:COG1361 S-layer family protein n=1 Tax=Thermococcus thioreducens TaxID=277988 RepID=UPI000ABA9CA2|nr:COG1361 S-layer family protein [Thermococcus thioreducens]
MRFTLENTGAEPVKALSLKISSYKVPVQGEIKNVDLSALSQLPAQGSEQLSQSLQDALNGIMAQLAKQNIEAFLPIGEDNVKYLSELQPGEKATLEFRIKANEKLENGIYPLRIELKYITEPNEKEITDERLVGIDVTGRAQLILSKVSTSPGKIIPGTDNVEVDFQVDNVGTGTARTVIVKPMPGWPFSLSESSEQVIGLGSLGKGDSAHSSFKINVAENASSGTYEIPLLITYTNDLGMEKNVTLKVPIIIGAKPNIEVVGVDFAPEPLQGERVKVYIKLKNTGGEKATSVLIEGVVKADQPFSLDKRTDYIGDLAPGATGEGVIVLRIDGNAIPKDYNIQLRIRAVGDPAQGDDNVYVFERTVTIAVKENTKTQTNLRNLAIVIGVLVIIAVLYTYRKRSS